MSRFSSSSFLLLPFLSLFLVLGSRPIIAQSSPSPSPVAGNDLITTACDQANHRDFCIHVLKSDGNSSTADIKGLAYIVLRHAENNISATYRFIQGKVQGESSDVVQQSLMDCNEHYLTADELVEDAISSLVAGVYGDVSKFAKAAVADLDTCDLGVRAQKDSSPDALVVANKNQVIRQLINTGITIAHVAATANAAH